MVSEVLIKNIEVSELRDHSHHCPPWFRHAKRTVKGTGMGYRNFSLAKIGQWQPPQQANKDTTRRRRVVP
jgi:hypothetical protein